MINAFANTRGKCYVLFWLVIFAAIIIVTDGHVQMTSENGLGWTGKPYEKLSAARPQPLTLDAQWYPRERGGQYGRCPHRCVHRGHVRASVTIRSHNSGNEIPAAAAACGTRLNPVIPGKVFASRQ